MDTDATAWASGAAAAAFLAGGMGFLALGVVTLVTHGAPGVRPAVAGIHPAGVWAVRLALAAAVWLVVWLALHRLLHNRPVGYVGAYWAMVVLVNLGLVALMSAAV